MSQCPCTRPTQGWLCTTCLKEFRTTLAKIPDLLTDLEVTVAKQSKTGGGQMGSGPTGSAPPVNLSALCATLDLDNMLRAMWAHTGHSVWVPDTAVVVQGILDHLPRLAAKECVISYRNQLAQTITDGERLVDVPAHTIILGPCQTTGCGQPLTADEGDTETRCPTCGNTMSIRAYRIGRVLEAIGDNYEPVRASEAVRRLRDGGLPLTTMDVKNWVSRGKLHAVAVDEHARRLFNLVDVYVLAMPAKSPSVVVDAQ